MRTSEVIEVFGGSRKAVAEALGISYSAVSQWGDLVPPLSAVQLAGIKPSLRFDPSVYKDWYKQARKSKRH